MTITQEQQQYLAKLIMTIAHSERNVESARVELANNPNFVPFTYFRSLDKKRQGYLLKEDLAEFLKSHNINPSTKEIDHLFKIHSPLADRITYNDFLMQLLPQANSVLKNKCLERVSREQRELSQFDQTTVDNAVLGVFQKEIEFYRQVYKARVPFLAMNDFDHAVVFQAIDTQNEGFLDFKNLSNFLKPFHFSFTQEDYDALIRRIDKSNNGKISLIDFRGGFFPYEPKASGQSSGYLAFSKGASGSQLLQPQPLKNGLGSVHYDRTNQFQSPPQHSASRTNFRSAGSYDIHRSHQSRDYLSPYRHEITSMKMNRERQAPSVLNEFLLDRAHRVEFEGGFSNQNNIRDRPEGARHRKTYSNKTESPDKLSEANVDTVNEERVEFTKQRPTENSRTSHSVQPRNYQTIDSEDFDKYRGIYLPNLDPLRDLHLDELQHQKVHIEPTYQESAPEVQEPDYQAKFSASGHEAMRDPRNQFLVHRPLRNAETSRRGSPVHRQVLSPQPGNYWSYNSHHNRTVMAAHPYAEHVFPYDTLPSTRHATLDNINSLPMQDYILSLEEERMRGKWNKDNDFKFTDHQNHYKGYYNQLRKNYVDKFYNMTLTQRQKFFYNDPEAHESKLYEDIPPRVRQPLYRGQEHHEPKQIPFRELIRDPTYTLDKGYWPASIRGSGMLSKYIVGKLEEKKQSPMQRPDSVKDMYEEFRNTNSESRKSALEPHA